METDRQAPLFWIGVLALFTASTHAALRAAVAHQLKTSFIDPIDPVNAASLIGDALGAAFLGFALMLAATSFLLDFLGFRTAFLAASCAFVLGTLTILGCGLAGPDQAFRAIWIGMFITGLGWGITEGTINPLVATLYPEEKAHRLNILHAYFPAGLIAGGLIGAMGEWIDWHLALAVPLILALGLGALTLAHRFPPTHSTQLGMRTGDKIAEFLRHPVFFLWFALMFLTSATELAPGQWVDVALSNVVGMRGILLLVYVSALMFTGRHFAGPLVHKISSEGLLCVSSVLATIGLYLLSVAHSPVSAFLAATCWGLGVCYFWPTMMSVAAERVSRATTWAVGLMGLAGALSSYFVLPMLGRIYDSALAEASAKGADSLAAQTLAATRSFQGVAILPAVLFVAFALLWLPISRRKPSR